MKSQATYKAYHSPNSRKVGIWNQATTKDELYDMKQRNYYIIRLLLVALYGLVVCGVLSVKSMSYAECIPWVISLVVVAFYAIFADYDEGIL